MISVMSVDGPMGVKYSAAILLMSGALIDWADLSKMLHGLTVMIDATRAGRRWWRLVGHAYARAHETGRIRVFIENTDPFSSRETPTCRLCGYFGSGVRRRGYMV